MSDETLHHRGSILVRRQVLAPGEATKWHRDPFHRVSVVLSGKLLSIEFRNPRSAKQVRVETGQVDWSEPSDPVHRAVNIGDVPYEEITVFFLSGPDDDPQPEAT
ncbi:MAG TPA: hypothetical protein VEI01_00510 [Terriglobales bacterium]|nr:hypothetical protein [Terriglobales bacterium]